jgi:iron(III) transport system substrate-binding protein
LIGFFISRLSPTILAMALVACSMPGAGGNTSPAGKPAEGASDTEWQKVVDAAKREGTVLIYGNVVQASESPAFAEEFNKATGISLDIVGGASGAPLAQRLKTETQAGQPSADVFGGGSQFVRQLKAENLFQVIKDKPLPVLPVLKEPTSVWRIQPLAMSPDGDIPIYRPTSQYEGHIIVNTSLLPAADFPKSYHELAIDPKYKGKIAYVDPKITGDLAARYVQHGYVTSNWSLEDIWSLYTNQSMMLFPGPNDQGGAAGRGEIAIGLGANAGNLPQLARAGSPLKILAFPDAPLVGNPQTLGVLKAAPHPNAALVFMNWFLSKEGQEVAGRLDQHRGVRKDVPSFIPDSLRGEVVGGGQTPKHVLLTDAQSDLAADLHRLGLFTKLPDGISRAEFENGVNAAIKEWEAKQGGPQKETVPLND